MLELLERLSDGGAADVEFLGEVGLREQCARREVASEDEAPQPAEETGLLARVRLVLAGGCDRLEDDYCAWARMSLTSSAVTGRGA